MIDFDYIEGTKFISVADLKYCCKYDYYPHAVYDTDLNEENLNSIDKEIITVYTNTFCVNSLFEILNRFNTSKKIVLITHNSDDEVNAEIFGKKSKIIIKWYSTNVNYNNNDLISIPIGLENPIWYNADDKINKIYKKSKDFKDFKNLLYINHAIDSYAIEERTKPYQLFRNKNWATLVEGRNGQNFDGYLDNLSSHKFILSPIGNGIDCHRLWEILYIGNIPIVIKNKNNLFYSDLPILYVDSWEEITETFLNERYEIIEENKRNDVYNMKKLTFMYWKNLIQNTNL